MRLDVAVDDAAAVGERERAEDLTCVVDRDRDGRRAVADEQLLERAAVQVLHRDVVGAFGLAAVEDRDDVRVVEAGGALRLAAEALDELVVVGVPLVQELQRHAAAELLVLGEVDVGHPTRAELAQDQVAAVELLVQQGISGHSSPTSSSTPAAGSPA